MRSNSVWWCSPEKLLREWAAAVASGLMVSVCCAATCGAVLCVITLSGDVKCCLCCLLYRAVVRFVMQCVCVCVCV